MTFILFIIILALIFFSFFVINTTNPIYSSISLTCTFFIASILLFSIGCDFLGFVFILIYVGAIAIFFLLVVMMLQIKPNPKISINFIKFGPLSYFIGFIFLFEILYPFWNLHSFRFSDFFFVKSFYSFKISELTLDIEIFGQILYTHYLVFFLMSGFILFIALIGSLTLLIGFNNNTISDLKKKETSTILSNSSFKLMYPRFFKGSKV